MIVRTVFVLLAVFAWLDGGAALAQTPTVGFDPNIGYTVNVNEGDGVVTLYVCLSEGSSETIKVDYATSNGSAMSSSDYSSASGTLTFAPWETKKEIQITIIDDSEVEDTESFWVTLSNPENADLVNPGNELSVFIFDDDVPPPTVQFDLKNYYFSEGDGSAAINVTLSEATAGPVTVKYQTKNGSALAGSDYTTTSGTLTFAANETSKTILVPIINDSVPESDETFSVELSEPTGATLGSPTSTEVTIYDDDPPLPAVDIEIEESGTDDDFVFLTPSDSEEKVTASANVYLAMPQGADVSVTLSTEPGGGVFLFSTDGTSWTSTLFLILPMNGDPVAILLSGDTASADMNDAVILAQSAGQDVGKKEGTVPSIVEISFKYTETDTVKGVVTAAGDNAAKDNYKGERIPETYDLGQGEFKLGWAWGVLTIGKITPADFKEEITLARNVQGRFYVKEPGDEAPYWGSKADYPANIFVPPGNDTPTGDLVAFLQDRDPQSGGSKGTVYDWDAPFCRTTNLAYKKGTIMSQRGNFYVFGVHKNKRVSAVYMWYIKQSFRKTDEKDNIWETDDTVTGDNEVKDGAHIVLSYGLERPVIDKLSSDTLKKTDATDGKIFLGFEGMNFVRGCTVVLKRGADTVTADVLDQGLDTKVATTISGIDTMANGEWSITLTNPADPNRVATATVTIAD